MTKTIVDPALMLVQQLSELRIQLRAVDTTDNQGEPCTFCQDRRRANSATLYGSHPDTNELMSLDCCVHCMPAVAAEYFRQDVTVVAEVAR